VTDAEEALRRLADLYWAGLSRALHLFAESSYAYAARVHKDQDPDAGLRDARKAWDENEFTGRGEETDPYHRLAFRDADPLDEEFIALAETVFLPLLGHQEEA
jgi:exodeoxyribonuclease V gamma subunit